MKPVTSFLVLLAVSLPAESQSPSAATKQLGFLAGTWQGQGWAAASGGKAVFTDTETVTSTAGGLRIVSVGTTATGAPARQGTAVVAYDTKAKAFHLRTTQPDGSTTDAPAQVSKNTLTWIVRDPHHGDIRFTIQVTSQGQWIESGALSRDDKQWSQFMGLTLHRVP